MFKQRGFFPSRGKQTRYFINTPSLSYCREFWRTSPEMGLFQPKSFPWFRIVNLLQFHHFSPFCCRWAPLYLNVPQLKLAKYSQNHISISALLFCSLIQNLPKFEGFLHTQFCLFGLSGTHLYMHVPWTYFPVISHQKTKDFTIACLSSPDALETGM